MTHKLNLRLFVFALFNFAYVPLFAQYSPGGGLLNSNLQLWLDADAGVNLTAGVVESWNDQSTNAFIFSQNDAAKRPQFISGALNDRPLIRFDGSNDQLLSLALPSFDNQKVFTVFTVVKSNRPNSQSTVFYSNYGADQPFWGLYTAPFTLIDPDDYNYFYFESEDNAGDPIAIIGENYEVVSANPSPKLVSAVWNGDASLQIDALKLKLNGLTQSNSSGSGGIPNVSPGSHLSTSIGAFADGSAPLDGDIAEIIFFDQELNDAQITIIENYLVTKYNLSYSGSTVAYVPPSVNTYVKEIAGIGRSANGSQNQASSGGLIIESNTGANDFLNGINRFLMFAHNGDNSNIVSTDLAFQTSERWEKDWYLNFTGNSGGQLNLRFDFSEAGQQEAPSDTYALLYRPNTGEDFEIIALSSSILNGDQVSFDLNTQNLSNGYYSLAKYQGLPGSGSSIALDGSDDFLEIPNRTSTNFTNGAFSLELWVKTSDNSVSLLETADSDAFLVQKSLKINASGNLVFAVHGDNVDNQITSSTILNDNQWHHVVGVYSSGDVRLYQDGIEVGNGNWDAGNTNTSTPWYVGQSFETVPTYFTGEIDEIRIWNIAKTLNQVRTEMASKVDFNRAELVSYFNLDDAASGGNKNTFFNLADFSQASLRNFDFNSSSGWFTSGARLGDFSLADYSGATNLSFVNPSGESDQLSINITSGDIPVGIQLYYVDGIPNVTNLPSGGSPTLASIDGSRYWGIMLIGGGSYTYTATYNYAANSNINSDENLEFIYREDNAQINWLRADGVTVQNNLNTNTQVLSISGLSGTEIILASTAGALPITLLEFKAELTDEQEVRLQWSTLSERNNAFFEIERSENGQDFVKIATIEGAGNSQERRSYKYLDSNPAAEWNYYRLKQVDSDGNFTYSPVEALFLEASMSLNFYPNPVQARALLDIKGAQAGKAELWSSQGKLVLSVKIAAGDSQIEFDLQNLRPGVYFLKSDLGRQSKMIRIVKN